MCAEETIPSLVKYHVERHANTHLVACIKTAVSPGAPDLTRALVDAVTSSLERVTATAAAELSEVKIRELVDHHREMLQADLASGRWKQTFRGRDILKRYTRRFMNGLVKYPVFRDLIVSRMREDQYRPSGMRDVIEEILVD